MKNILSIVSTLIVITSSNNVLANNKTHFETEISLGGPVGLVNTVNTTSQTTFALSQRAWLPKSVSPFGLEARMVSSRDGQFGLGLSPMLSLVNTNAFQMFISLGLFYNAFDAISVQRIHRKFDIICSFHTSFNLTDNLYLSVSYNIFIPEFEKMAKLGDYGRPVAYEALQGGQLWVGLNFQY
jgi:hypothetical protein